MLQYAVAMVHEGVVFRCHKDGKPAVFSDIGEADRYRRLLAYAAVPEPGEPIGAVRRRFVVMPVSDLTAAIERVRYSLERPRKAVRH